MRDFTHKMYINYLKAIKENYAFILRFDEFMALEKPLGSICLIRHDVDRKIKNAERMALIEAEAGIKSTYYVRTKKSVFDADIIRSIYELGHEIGYHYENLSDFNGNIDLAIQDFGFQLKRIRDIVPVKTISMHGRPLSRYDNRDMWKSKEKKELLIQHFKLLGEVYLDIDYSEIVYIGDTGRNWKTRNNNKRDIVNSSITPDFRNGNELLAYLTEQPPNKLVFQIHPERWSDNLAGYYVQLSRDLATNFIKRII